MKQDRINQIKSSHPIMVVASGDVLFKKAALQEANALKARSGSFGLENLINNNLCISPEKVKNLRPSFGR